MSPHRLTRRQRTNRIRNRIINAGKKGISIKQIARLERISLNRTYYYLRFIRMRKRGARIKRLGKKYYYVKPRELETPKPTIRGNVELRGYFNYSSSTHPSSDIEIDCVIIVPNEQQAIIAGSEQITQKVKQRLGAKLASRLKFGVSEATPSSTNHFLFRRRGGELVEF